MAKLLTCAFCQRRAKQEILVVSLPEDEEEEILIEETSETGTEKLELLEGVVEEEEKAESPSDSVTDVKTRAEHVAIIFDGAVKSNDG